MIGKLFNDDWSFCPCEDDKSPREKPRMVTLPHDASIFEKRNPDVEGAGKKAYFPNGIYLYQKQFDVFEEWCGKQIYIFFEGIYRNAKVYVNDEYVGGIANGYTELFLEISSFLKYGKQNQIRVEARTGNDSRWYSGAGIYRNVHLIVADAVHIAHNGIRLTTKSVLNKVAAIEVEIQIENNDLQAHYIRTELTITDPEGSVVAEDTYQLRCRGNMRDTIFPRIYIRNAKLWDCDHPHLYHCHVKLMKEHRQLDEAIVTFGIRMLSLDSENGLCINGKPIKLYGGCIHHDNGIIGSISLKEAEERRIKLLKDAGYNSIRSSHNPASQALLDACDKYGMTVMDEFGDVWNVSKSPEDDSVSFETEWDKILTAMVKKDRNHPSVILYSIGNEIPEAGNQMGAETARRLSNRIRSMDDTRFITCGINGLMANLNRMGELFGNDGNIPPIDEEKKLEINQLMNEMGGMMKDAQMHPEIVKSTLETMESLDIAGYNYADDRYLSDAAKFSNWIALGTETFPKDLAVNWKLTTENSNVLGDYSWTAWDYLGEVGIGMNHFDEALNGEGLGGAYPYIAAYCGDFDLIGRRRPQSYYRELIVGNRTDPYIAVYNPKNYQKQAYVNAWSWFPTESTWTFYGCEGMKTGVEVYSVGQEVELMLNGKSLGKKPVPQNSTAESLAGYVKFETTYETGELKAITYENDQVIGTYCISTAGKQTKLQLETSVSEVTRKGQLIYVSIRLTDEAGTINTQLEKRVYADVTGCGELLGIGTGNPISEEVFYNNTCTTYQGEALLAVRSTVLGKIRIIIGTDEEEQTVEINALHNETI